jgi:hypothetical protein
MKNRTGLYCALAGGMLACAAAAFAQTVPNMILVTTIKVKPEMRQEWLDMQKNEVTPAYRKAGVKSYEVWTTALFGDADEFTTTRPVSNFATFDADSPVIKTLGAEAANRLIAKLNKCTVSTQRVIVKPRPDLGMAEDSGAPPKFMVLANVNVKTGMGGDYERWFKNEVLPGLKKGGMKTVFVASNLYGGPISEYHALWFVDSFADLDKPSALVAGLGQEGADKVTSHATMVQHAEYYLLRLIPELSIFPVPSTN